MLTNHKGQAVVECAVATLLFFGVLFAIVDLSLMCYARLTMQHAVREGTRLAITGRGSDRRNALIQKIRASSNGLYDKNRHDPADPQISVVTPSQMTSFDYSGTPATFTSDEADKVIRVNLTYTWPLVTFVLKPLLPDGYTFTVSTTMKNEQF